MRKLTGYIGALIILFALMGSILAGYALNINGTSTVMNEYEKVTDVSGLYSHTQEPAYIDYNPASNYIGYEQEIVTYNSDAGIIRYKDLQNNETVIIKPNGEISINGVSEGIPSGDMVYFFTNQFYIEKTSGGVVGISSVVGSNYSITTNITITISGTNTTVATTGFNVTFMSIYHNICYWIIDEKYDYYRINGRATGNNTNYNAYFRTANDVLTLSSLSPAMNSNDPSTYTLLFTQGGGYAVVGNNAEFGLLPNQWVVNNRVPIYGGGYQINANFQNTTDYWGNASTPGNKTLSGIWVFYPRSVTNGGGLGIDYTESNRVNNYPIETEYSTISGTHAAVLDLMTLSAANQSNGTWILDRSGGSYNSGSVDAYWMANNYISYKLSDIIPTLNPPSHTKIIRFQYNIHGAIHNYYYYDVNGDSTKRVGMSYYVPYNPVTLTLKSWASAPGINKPTTWTDGYVDYNIDTGLCDYYNNDGVKQGTNTPSELCISFIPNNVSTSTAKIYVTGQYNYEDSVTYPLSVPQTPTVNIIYTTSGTITDIHYSDISKGYSIKNTNTTNTIWNNEYNNGKIQLLFRSEGTPGYYHNDISIGDNNISIDYEQNKYLVTLNGGDPVNIGTWRNIILDINMINGELSAIPVRTFNNYTNVVIDNTSIFIGELVNPAATNIIEWAPTPNSLMFNIYNTAVFMDTYGVVMVDPTLDITSYFTDLNNFYQLRLSDFSMYGQSMTVNGVTGTVTGNTITFNDETIQIKDMEITYADGNAYISDSYATIDLGAITDNTISMTGAWYFITDLYDGYTVQKMVYDWDWGDFILEDKAFGVIYIGLCLIGLIIARHYCTMSIADYLLFVVSIVIALTVQVIV